MRSAPRALQCNTRRRRLLCALLAGVAAAACVPGVATAMTVQVAQVTRVVGTQCSYQVGVAVPSQDGVVFAESDIDGGRRVVVATGARPKDGVAQVRWTPRMAGDRVLVAVQGAAQTPPLLVSVRPGGGRLCG